MSNVIVITGASSGFGALTARALADAGHTVYAGMRETTGRNAPQVNAAADYAKSLGEAKALIDRLDLRLFQTRLGSAHVMGGCAMGEDAKNAVTDSLGRHHQLENLSIHDGSLFPTSIGANPQLSVYGLTAQLASGLAERLAKA